MSLSNGRVRRVQGFDGLRWRIVGASILTITVAILPGFLPGALAVQLAESLGIEEAGIGLIVGSFFGVSALVSSLMGRLTERLDWPMAARAAGAGAAITLFMTPVMGKSVLALGIVTIAGGVALALAHPAVNLALARCTPIGRRGLAYGFKHGAIPGATALAGLGLPLIAIPFGWQWVYVLGGVFALTAILLIPRISEAYEVGEQTHETSPLPTGRSSPMSLLVIVACGAGLGIFGMDALATFLVPYAVEIGFGEGPAGVLLAAGSGLGIVVRIIAGWLVDRRSTGGLVTVAVFLVAGAIGMGLLATGADTALVGGSLVAFAFGWGWSGLFTYAVVYRNPGAPGEATGITMTGVYVGAATGPALFGVIATSSFTAAWVVMSAALALGGGLMGLAIALERRRN